MKFHGLNFRYSQAGRVLLLFSFLLGLVVVGCGPSRQDLLMKAAQRSRGDDDEEPPRKPAPKPKKPEEVKPKVEPEKDVEEPKKEVVKVPEVPQKTLIPIQERSKKVSGEAARSMAANNLAKVSEALLAYMKEKKRLPRTYKEANGFKTLSWRVELLPYLGYQDLYEKFDASVPWDRSPNKELLQFIPDEYASPERGDETTNILMPAHRSFIGGEKGNKTEDQIEDGMSNTLLLVEANDDWAVPWSKPRDFEPGSPKSAKNGMIGKRKDGAFAVWANGWPVMLVNELPEDIFWKALTREAGDGLLAGKVHRDIPVAKVSKAATAAKEVKLETKPEESSSRPPSGSRPPEEPQIVRERVPNQSELADAKVKLRKLYAEKIKDATLDADRIGLAQEMLDQAHVLQADSVGAFALQDAGMTLAATSGGIGEMIGGVDQRIGRYEVDAYDENKKWLLEFGKQSGSRNPENLNGIEYVKRAIKVMYAGIYDDDYLDAGAICRYAYRLSGQRPEDPIPKKLNRLRTQLSSAKRAYDSAAEALSDLRNDPSDKDAAAEVGRYLCFIKGDWQAGLPLLRRGSNRVLAQIAALDMAGSKDLAGQVAIADAWWDLAEKARTGVYRQASRDRAVTWYDQAFEAMPDSLDRMHVKSRLDDAGEQLSTSPLSLLEELAKDAGVDLTVSLAAVADVGQGRNNDDDDDDDD